MRVPLLDLTRQYRRIRKEVLGEITKVCDSQRFILGGCVSALETSIARLCGSKYAVGVASGSDALLLSLMAFGVGPGDRVVTTPYTFFSTAGSIAMLGAEPVFVDILPTTFNMDPDALERTLKRTKRVKAVIPVHLFGQAALMGPIIKSARRHGVKIIEDAAQSILAEYKKKRVGSLGHTGCFSFYPTKNLGGFGDGGLVTTNSAATAAKLRALRVHGSTSRYRHSIVGVNSRLDEVQAAVLRVKLKHLKTWTRARQQNAARYRQFFEKAGLTGIVGLPVEDEASPSVYNQFVIRVRKRDGLRRYLEKHGVGTDVYYPLPLHLQKCFKYLGLGSGDLPHAELAASQTLALPVFAELKPSEQRYVVDCIASFYEKHS